MTHTFPQKLVERQNYSIAFLDHLQFLLIENFKLQI